MTKSRLPFSLNGRLLAGVRGFVGKLQEVWMARLRRRSTAHVAQDTTVLSHLIGHAYLL